MGLHRARRRVLAGLALCPTACLLLRPPLPAGDKALDGYSKKKYVCKLLFIFLLGHDIDFGHMEAVNLLSSNRYTEKQIVSGGRGARPCPRGPLRRGRFFLAFFLSL